jgi:hypothetical protein
LEICNEWKALVGKGDEESFVTVSEGAFLSPKATNIKA